jgi:hypothetical protein
VLLRRPFNNGLRGNAAYREKVLAADPVASPARTVPRAAARISF